YFSFSRERLRKTLKSSLPEADATWLPKTLHFLDGVSVLLHSSSFKPGDGNCSIVTRPMILLMPSGLMQIDMPASVIADRLTSAKRTRRSTWLLGGPGCAASRLTTLSLLST